MSNDMPEGWSNQRLGDVVTFKTDGISADAIAKMSAVAHYSLPAFDEGREPQTTVGQDIKSNKFLVPSDCVLFSKLNPRIPRVWRVSKRSHLPSVCSTEFWPLVARSEKIDLDFLSAFIGSEAFLNDPQITPSSSTNSHQRVDRRSFENFVIPMPPLDEQGRIAEVLRSVDKLFVSCKASISAARSMRQAALNAVMREEASSAELLPLDMLAQVRTGVAKNTGRTGEKLSLPYLRVANVQDGWIDLNEVKTIEIEPRGIDRYSLRKGDVLLTEGGDFDKLGRGGVWSGEIDPCLHQNHVFAVRPDAERLSSEFLALVTQSSLGRAYFLSCAKRTTNLASINSSQLKKLPVPSLTLRRQQDIVAEIGSIDSFIEAEQLGEARLKRLRSVVGQDLLSGQVRVPA